MTRPPARNAGFSAASPSSDVSGRRNSSRSATFQPVVGEDGHRHDRLPHHAVLPGRRRALLRLDRERVRALLRDRREAVVQVLGGLAHRRGGLVDQPLGDEARIEVDVLAHRVMAHVLDAAGERDVDGAERDLSRGGRDRGERACAHAVDREARHRVGDAGEQRDVAAEGQALVADLRGRREHDVADPLRRDLRVAPQQLADRLDAHVVGARAPVLALRAGLAERRPDAVDEEDLARFAHRDSRYWRGGVVGAGRGGDRALRRGARRRGLDQRQLTQLGNAAWAAGLSLLMAGRRDEAAGWLPPLGGALPRELERCAARLVGPADRRDEGAAPRRRRRRRTPRAGRSTPAPPTPSPRSAATPGALALLVLGDDLGARVLGSTLRDRDDFPPDVADALVELAGADRVEYAIAIDNVLESFEQRADFLEDVRRRRHRARAAAARRAPRRRGRARAVAAPALGVVRPGSRPGPVP